MTYYIVIRGPLGIGKTTIAQKLAKQLGAEYISIDKVLEDNGLDKIEGKSIPVNNFIRANQIMLPHITEIVEKGKSVVFDGNFYYKRQIRDLEQRMGTLQGGLIRRAFTLKASLNTCMQRDSQRERPYGPDATKAVYNAVIAFRYGIAIDTENKSADEVVKEIRSHLK